MHKNIYVINLKKSLSGSPPPQLGVFKEGWFPGVGSQDALCAAHAGLTRGSPASRSECGHVRHMLLCLADFMHSDVFTLYILIKVNILEERLLEHILEINSVIKTQKSPRSICRSIMDKGTYEKWKKLFKATYFLKVFEFFG